MTGRNLSDDAVDFDPYQKEQQLRNESSSWDTSRPQAAQPDDIPIIDLSSYFENEDQPSLEKVASEVRIACEQTGFFSIVGHGITEAEMEGMFKMVREFHGLPDDVKKAVLMDREAWPVKGVGYLPIKNRKLPARDKGNLNEAFIVKTDDEISLDQNQWIESDKLPGFREAVEAYSQKMERLGKKLLPLFATALDVQANYFDDAFVNPTWRLRMTHYPAVQGKPEDEFGIAPHVDTTFCTILAQDQPGLTIFSEKRQTWIKAPLIKNAFIVNSGELLRQWTNDRFISVKHFANNNISNVSRYSIPFFLNANRHYLMECVPTCTGPDNPPKYPAVSYAGSQAIAQGE